MGVVSSIRANWKDFYIFKVLILQNQANCLKFVTQTVIILVISILYLLIIVFILGDGKISVEEFMKLFSKIDYILGK